MYQRMEQDGREEHIRPATHFVSHSFTSTFDAIINMLETVAHDYEQKSNKQAFFFIDVLGNGYHPGRFVSAPWLVAHTQHHPLSSNTSSSRGHLKFTFHEHTQEEEEIHRSA